MEQEANNDDDEIPELIPEYSWNAYPPSDEEEMECCCYIDCFNNHNITSTNDTIYDINDIFNITTVSHNHYNYFVYLDSFDYSVLSQSSLYSIPEKKS